MNLKTPRTIVQGFFLFDQLELKINKRALRATNADKTEKNSTIVRS